MLSSIFSTLAPSKAPTFHPVSSRYKPDELFGELETKDLQLLCAKGFVTETQTFYTIAEDGTSIMCQIIHSSIGLWYPTVQFTCRVYNEAKEISIWRSINVSNFVTPPDARLDKRSSKADEYTITHHPATSTTPERFSIRANLSKDLQVSMDVTKPDGVPGFKIGKGPKGGFSYYGADENDPEGYMVHRFWPRTSTEGHVVHKGQALAFKGPGMFVHAIQGMRPNLVASHWNFAHFQSDAHGGVSAIQMEFTTQPPHGREGPGSGGVKANVGALVIGGKLVAVTAETKWPDETQAESAPIVSRATHLKPAHDSDTGCMQPSEIAFRWAAPSLGGEGSVDATLHIGVGGPQTPKGLIEKVDVLAEIPYFIKVAVNYVAGTKPYIYQWFNPAKLVMRGPDSLIPGLSGGLEIDGRLYNEATFI